MHCRFACASRRLACALLAAAALSGCSDDSSSPSAPGPGSPTQPAERPAERTENRRGLDATNEQEVTALVRGEVRERPVRCRTERLTPGAPGLYRCTAGPRSYRVEWAHYGTGAYTIEARPSGRVIARGTLSISQ